MHLTYYYGEKRGNSISEIFQKIILYIVIIFR